jgi:Carboxypeptidase regulatory-like domain
MIQHPRKIAQLIAFTLPFVFGPFAANAQNAPASSDSSADKTQTASISGIVVRAGTDEPLKKAHITLRSKNNEKSTPRAATTAADGKFMLEQVPPGTYGLRVAHDGYMPKSYGEDDAGQGAADLTLLAGHKITELIFRLEKYAVVSGRVTDEDGDPVRDASVAVRKRILRKGKTTLENEGRSKTNDLGEYRIYDIPPGHYVISAVPDEDRFQTPSTIHSDNADPNYTTTYYPSASSISRASEIELKAGDEVSSIDISLARIQTYSVRGHVTDLSGSNARPFYWIRASSEDTPESAEVTGIADFNDGAFELVGLLPGNYSLTVQGSDGMGHSLFGQTKVVISNTNVDSVNLAISAGLTIRGKVVLEGKSQLPSLVYVGLHPRNSEQELRGHQAPVAKDGTFELPQVTDGTYEIQAMTQTNDCYLKSAKIRGVDVLENGLEISGAAPGLLELVLSTRTAAVEGVVTKADDLPAVGATVWLVPDPPFRQRSTRYQQGTTDQYGHFSIRNVVPGGYKALAFQNLPDDFDVTDTDSIAPFESKGEAFSVEESGRKTLHLKLISTESQAPSK